MLLVGGREREIACTRDKDVKNDILCVVVIETEMERKIEERSRGYWRQNRYILYLDWNSSQHEFPEVCNSGLPCMARKLTSSLNFGFESQLKVKI